MKTELENITLDSINKKTKKQILIVLIIGLFIFLADIVSGSSGGNITVVESNGNFYMLRPEEGGETGHIYLKATVETENGVIEKDINVRLDPYEKEAIKSDKESSQDDDMVMNDEERIGYELRNMTNSFNKDSTAKRIELPTALESGEKISWEIEKQSNSLLIITGVLALVVIIYKSRLSPLQKQRKNREDSIIRNLPEFVNRLVLLLNAGLVLNSAFEKTIEESIAFQNSDGDYFSEKMHEIYMSMKNANGAMHIELRRFAKESGIKELIRISNIISDNVSKGVELTYKLQNENELLWINRKKNCEERSRTAETKLTLPLVIFLIVLIVIVISPALLEL